MKKTINKWDVISPTQKKIGKILKIIAATVFFAVWIPTMAHIMGEVIKLFIK